LGPNVVLAHVLGIDDAEIDCMARTGTTAAMCPVTAAKGGRGVRENGRLPELLAKGVKVALGCDSPNNSNHLDILPALNMRAIQDKDAGQDMRQTPAERALELATLTGAQALGVGDEIGSVEPGKKADLVLFDTQRPEWQALFNPVNNLVYNADGRSVHTVIIDGRVIVAGYRQTFVDESRLHGRLQAGGQRPPARTGARSPPPAGRTLKPPARGCPGGAGLDGSSARARGRAAPRRPGGAPAADVDGARAGRGIAADPPPARSHVPSGARQPRAA